MVSPTETSPPQDIPPTTAPATWPTHPQIEARETINFFVLVTHQIVFRVGWMFKTESVIIPAFLDTVAGAGWLRGCLPILCRLAQSVPPVFMADRIHALRRKKLALAVCALLMSIPFGVLAATCWATHDRYPAWMVALFLSLYFSFFCIGGIYQLSFGTLQGKLIRTTRRGRLLLTSTFWGTIPSIGVAVWLMPGWIGSQPPAYGHIFGFVSICFFISGLIVFLCLEPADKKWTDGSKAGAAVAEVMQALRDDANLRRLVAVVMLAGSGLLVFPHYQALASERLGLTGGHLVVWVVVQSASVGLLSILVGYLADFRGNRLTLQLSIVATSIAPALAIVLAQLEPTWGAKLFWTVFIAMGVTPLVLRTVVNYTLEICDPPQHARYLSTVALCGGIPFLFSPLVGWLVDVVGFETVFAVTVCLILISACVSLRLDEPRHRIGLDESPVIGLGTDE
ncbi:MAG: MFS transporter [Planctomycetota bacterium]|nr:MFS transporter [Planctomycetota bacterium]